MSGDHPTRRDVVRATGLLASGAVVSGVASGRPDSNSHDMVPTSPEEIRAAFDDVPRLEDPTKDERLTARHLFPELVVPDQGPIPDPSRSLSVTLDAPPWLLASAYSKERAQSGSEATYQSVEDRFLSRRQAIEEWVLPDGTDAVGAVAAALQEETDG